MRTVTSPDAALSAPTVDTRRAAELDLLTVAAIAVIVYAASNILHEGLGHGGACLLVGGRPVELTSVSFDCAEASLTAATSRVVSAAGTLANFFAGALALLALYRSRASDGWRFGLWLFGTINVMQGAGYFLFSGVGRIGDWSDVMQAVHPEWAWRVALAVGGFALYWFATVRLFRLFGALLGGEPASRFRVGNRAALVAYFTGGALYCVSGAFNPHGYLLLAISAAAASLGGTSGLVWGSQFLRGERAEYAHAPLRVARSSTAIVVAVVVAALFVGVLGPGISFGR